MVKITIAHSKGRQEAVEIVDRTFNDLFSGLAYSPIEIINWHKEWQGSVMTFSLTAKMGFLKNPVSGTVEVTDRDIIVTADLGVLGKLIPAEKIQSTIETRLRGLLG